MAVAAGMQAAEERLDLQVLHNVRHRRVRRVHVSMTCLLWLAFPPLPPAALPPKALVPFMLPTSLPPSL